MDFCSNFKLDFSVRYFFYKNAKLNVKGIYLFCIFSGKKIKIYVVL